VLLLVNDREEENDKQEKDIGNIQNKDITTRHEDRTGLIEEYNGKKIQQAERRVWISCPQFIQKFSDRYKIFLLTTTFPSP